MDKFEFQALKLVQTDDFVRRSGRFTLVLVVVFIALLFLPWRQTAQGNGTLMALDPTERVQSISAPISGFIENFYVTEDDYVQEGTKLFDMVDPDKGYHLRVHKMREDFEQQQHNIENELTVLQQNQQSLRNQKSIRVELFDKRYLQAKEALKNLQLKYQAQEKNYEVASKQFERTRELYSEHIESKRSYEQAENSVVTAQTEFEKASIDVDMQKRALAMIQEEKQQFIEEIDNHIRTLQNTLLSTQTRLNIVQREYQKHLTEIARFESGASVLSQKEGTIVRVLEQDKNSYIRQGAPVLRFAPKVTQSVLLLKVSDFNMPLIKRGLPVRIRFFGWPTLHIPGWPVIQFGTFGGIINRIDPIAHEPGAYYAYVVEDPNEPWPEQSDLRIGTDATAWVALSVVPIWYEIWRLMNGFPAKMVNLEPK